MGKETKRAEMILNSAKPRIVPPEQSTNKKPSADDKPGRTKES